MPKVLEINGYQFRFYSNENDEPVHVHVSKGGSNAKIWITPTIAEEYSYGFKVKERKDILRISKENQEQLINAWNEYFNK